MGCTISAAASNYFIPASNEPSSRARADIWRMPRGLSLSRKGGHGKVPWITRKESGKNSLRHLFRKVKSNRVSYPPKALSHAFLRGSLTVEAALALPIFLFLMVTVLYLFRIMQVQYMVGNALDAAVAEVSLMGRISGKEAENLMKASFYKELAVQDCPVSKIELGIAGFSWKGTTVDAGYIDAFLTYRLPIPFRFFGKKSMELSDGCRMHRWTGNLEGAVGAGTGEWVYVTPTQTVYHTSRECTHLKLSIKAVSLKNPAWKGYAPCSRCVYGKQAGTAIYITSEGDCYHYAISCSGLKRTIYMVLKENAGNKRACSRCGG